jgi:hypothetical protein
VLFDAGAGQGGRLRLLDANDATIAESTSRVFWQNTWHRIRILSDATDAGDIIVEVSDQQGVMREVFNLTNQDLDDGGSVDLRLNFTAQGVGGGSPCTMYVIDWAAWSGATDRNEFRRHWYCAGYQNRVDSATPDVGDDLNVGTWKDCAEIPFNDANYAQYDTPNLKGIVTTHTTDGGAIPGPYGDARIKPNDEIVAASWLLRYKGALIVNQQGKLHYGKTPFDETDVDNTTTAAITGIIIKDMLIVSEDPAYVPTRDDYFQYGFSQQGGPLCDVRLYDAVCSLMVETGAQGIGLGCGHASREKDILNG